ncbi:c4-dicarboxylate abc transporter [Anaeramoeba ignava]|uniref:C4-dicarboxylate abc transporter n=1 Tax=Anaeramoeba ignava TaxID=1746090 RepID=A0A9Q0R6D4_ANAIG|nr:c4-dicarboxylate abc transporter [Anaeramoeba ignava]
METTSSDYEMQIEKEIEMVQVKDLENPNQQKINKQNKASQNKKKDQQKLDSIAQGNQTPHPQGNANGNSQKKPSWIKFVPNALFATVMGTGGNILVWKKAEPALNVSPTIWKVIFWITFGQAILIALIYLAKMIRYPEAVIMEIKNQIRINFFPAVNIILLIFSIALIPEHKTLAESFNVDWSFSSTLDVTFIPIVAPLLVSIPAGKLDYNDIGWFFMAFGLFFWIIIMTNLFSRIAFRKSMDAKYFPSFWIILAPPSIALIGYLSINPPHYWDHFCDFLFYTSFFHFIILLSLTDYIFKSPPCLTFIAITFPLDAFAIASLEYHLHMDNIHTKRFGWIITIFSTVCLGLVLGLILVIMFQGKLFVPENKKMQCWWWKTKSKRDKKTIN